MCLDRRPFSLSLSLSLDLRGYRRREHHDTVFLKHHALDASASADTVGVPHVDGKSISSSAATATAGAARRTRIKPR